MEGFEIVHKYNEKCLTWRCECAKLLGDWASAGDDKDAKFVKETKIVGGFLCAKSNGVIDLLDAVATARIEYVILALRWLRQRNQAPTANCNFCTRLAEKGEHVAGCVGETPRCKTSLTTPYGEQWCCELPSGHKDPHDYVRRNVAPQ